jgi:hypothetical protein
MADGKIYVGTENGHFFILRPHADRAEVLSDVQLPLSKDSYGGSEGTPEQIQGGAAISRGRIFFMSSDAVYAIGPRTAKAVTGSAVNEPAAAAGSTPAYLQVTPTEMVLEPGQVVKMRARLFDAQGRYIRDDASATWSLEGLRGTVQNGTLTIAKDPVGQAGLINVTSGALTGFARARVVHPLPWKEDFEGFEDKAIPPGWVNAAAGRLSVVTLEGGKVLEKAPTNTIFKRIRAFIGPASWSNYTFEASVRAATRRRQMGDVGITAQRYSLVLYGTTQKLKLEPWEPETQRTVTVPFTWQPDTWYRLKLRVENLANGQVRAQGKAWPAGQPEPSEWIIDKVDPIGNRQGAPGFFVDAEFGAHIDDLSLAANQ